MKTWGRELQKIWNVKVKIMLLVVGSSAAIPRQFGNRLNRLVLQQGTAGILRKVLEI